jgi:hypothetical protein
MPCFFRNTRNSSSKLRFRWCSACDWMYVIVVCLFEIPTVKAPYPSCQANFPAKVSFSHFDDPPLSNCSALATVIVAGSDNKTWTWSSVPPANKSYESISTRDPAEVGPELGLHVARDDFSSFFGGENAVDQFRYVGVGHNRLPCESFQPSLRDWPYNNSSRR